MYKGYKTEGRVLVLEELEIILLKKCRNAKVITLSKMFSLIINIYKIHRYLEGVKTILNT